MATRVQAFRPERAVEGEEDRDTVRQTVSLTQDEAVVGGLAGREKSRVALLA